MATEMNLHVARQPIFDSHKNVFAYELLFRNSFENRYTALDGDQATNDVIANSFLHIGIESLTNGKKAFINFTANSLRNRVPAILPKEYIAVEILENVIPDQAIIEICKELKNDGYMLVLDDFVFEPSYKPLIELADIIKVDFRNTSLSERQQLIRNLKGYPVKLLAEKVETEAEFQEAMQMGFSYFQGYFFCKPVVITRKNIHGYKSNYLHVLQELNRSELEYRQIEDIIKKDVALSYKLLKFINSAAFSFERKISSLRQALTLLGRKELIKWVSLIALRTVPNDKPGELILSSLIRAKFAETLMASKTSWQKRSPDAFLLGLFSHIDALVDIRLEEILSEMPLDDSIKDALLGKNSGVFYLLYKLIQTYERGEWEDFERYRNELELAERDVLLFYRNALFWAHEIIVTH